VFPDTLGSDYVVEFGSSDTNLFHDERLQSEVQNAAADYGLGVGVIFSAVFLVF
jgi:hypothetical protein